MHFRHYSLRNKISSKISFQCSLILIWSKSSMELSPEFHGTFWTTYEQHLWFRGIPWNSMEFCPDPKFHGIPWNFFHTPEFHGIPWNFWFSPKKSNVIPWNFFEVPWNSMELENLIFKKIIFLNIVVGIWLKIWCYLAKISQKRYILHWFQYRNSYFEHPVSAKMAKGQRKWRAVIYIHIYIYIYI